MAEIDGCTALEGLPPERLVLTEIGLLELVITATIVDRTDRAAIDARVAAFRRLRGV